MAYIHLGNEQAISTRLSNLTNKRSPYPFWRKSRTASQCLSHLCLSKHLSDISFTFKDNKDVKLQAHKLVLSMRSDVFEAMFYGAISEGGKTVTIEDIEPEVMKTVLKFVYDDETEINGENVLPCLYTAKKYNISGLVQQCSEFLENNINENNVCQVHEHAILYDMKPLQERCRAVIIDNATLILSSPDFLSLSQATLLNILKSGKLACDEIDVFSAVKRWAEHKCEVQKISKTGQNMRKQLKEAVFQIRFPIIPIEKFAQVVDPSGILTKEELLMMYQYNATKGTTPIGTFRHEQRSEPTITVDLRKHNNSKTCTSTGKSLALQVSCTSYRSEKTFYNDEEPNGELQDDGSLLVNDGLSFRINRKSLKLKSITGKFVRNLKNITCNENIVKGYKVIEDKIVFETPIEMFHGENIQFKMNNWFDLNYMSTPEPSNPDQSRQSKSINISQYKCTITKFPADTEIITFLK